MAQGARRPPRHTRQSSRLANLVTGKRLGSVSGPKEKTSRNDNATVEYIKQILCSTAATKTPAKDATNDETEPKPLEELLPPLTSSNEIDIQLYAIIAIILHQFVQTWYNKITPDQDFVQEIVQIIAHCTRALEQRLRSLDTLALLLNEVPSLIDAHIEAVEIASRAHIDFDELSDKRSIYHTLRPHPALAPVPVNPGLALKQREHETAWSQLLVDRILPLVLPPEDLHNPCLEVLVGEIFSEMIVHNGICGKACEGWLVWEGVTKFINSRRSDLKIPPDTSTHDINRLEQYGLLPHADVASRSTSNRSTHGSFDLIAQIFWSTLQIVSLGWMLFRAFAIALMSAPELPARSSFSDDAKSISTSTVDADLHELNTGTLETREDPVETTQPIVCMSVWACLSNMIRLQWRMPWLTGLLSLLQWLSLHGPGQVCCTDSRLDRLLSFHIQQQLLNPAIIPSALQAIRSAVFPDNALGPARIPPTKDEIIVIKQDCAIAIVSIIPGYLRSVYFGTRDEEMMAKDVEVMLEVLSDSYINKSLIIAVLELVLARLFPELTE